jgi:peptidoglycan hydrolase-like protein with peptidoglycan-binding domain
VPKLRQPQPYPMPSPGEGLTWGSQGPLVALYQSRMKQLHFDPGPIDGIFSQNTEYAVVSVQKYYHLPRTGRIDAGVQAALSNFRYSVNVPSGDANRVEIDLDRQTLTLVKNGQVALITTTSTGSGEYFCGGVDGCQYAITPTGHFHFYDLIKGWQVGKLGTMWNPYYFNGSDAVHGLDSVPSYPASHGCARIPMRIANYFYKLVYKGMSVYVVGTPMKAGNLYVGPVRTVPSTVAQVTTPSSTAPQTTVTVAAPPPTTKKTTPATSKPRLPTTTPTKRTPPTTKKTTPTKP